MLKVWQDLKLDDAEFGDHWEEKVIKFMKRKYKLQNNTTLI